MKEKENNEDGMRTAGGGGGRKCRGPSTADEDEIIRKITVHSLIG